MRQHAWLRVCAAAADSERAAASLKGGGKQWGERGGPGEGPATYWHGATLELAPLPYTPGGECVTRPARSGAFKSPVS